ncbi:methyltransferase [Arcanobacterium hippocoleae]
MFRRETRSRRRIPCPDGNCRFLRLCELASQDQPGKRQLQARQREFAALDLGCGNGLVSRALADVFVNAKIFDTDISADAVTSTHLTMLSEILDGRVKISWDDAAHSIPDGEMDLVFLNPPFHQGTEIDPTIVQHLLDAAAAKLAANGLLYFVHNSHLRYRQELEKRFGAVIELARNPKFTVLRAAK